VGQPSLDFDIRITDCTVGALRAFNVKNVVAANVPLRTLTDDILTRAPRRSSFALQLIGLTGRICSDALNLSTPINPLRIEVHEDGYTWSLRMGIRADERAESKNA
jgi:hypothetical protein